MDEVLLVCHPETPCRVPLAIGVRVERSDARALLVKYRLQGDLERLRIPPPGPSRPGAELWRHTCCELFAAAVTSEAYDEYNFSPSGEWGAYAFERYRSGAPVAADDPQISVRRHEGTLELSARVRVPAAPLVLGLSAVVEDRDGALSFWALRHTAARPDFHRRGAFAFELQ